MNTKPKYIEVELNQLNEKYKEGYELVSLFTYSSIYNQYMNGHFMGNDISIGNMPVQNIYTKALMQLSKHAETLYGEKRENIT
jgi:hypothetical protein